MRDGNDGSYVRLLEFIKEHGHREQLFRQVVFNVLVGNRDYHLRN